MAEFSKLLGKVTDAVYAELPTQDGAISAAGIDTLLAEAKKALSPDLRRTLIATAGDLIDADGADEEEEALVEKIRRALG